MMRKLSKTIGDQVFENIGRAAGRVQENKPLPADVLESDDAYLVVFDAPGATAADVQVRYVDDRIEARVDRFREFYDGFEMVYPGRGLSLSGSATLPGDAVVEAEDATATLDDDGTLTVRVPKGWGSPGPGGESAEGHDTVEEAVDREDAGSPVGNVDAPAAESETEEVEDEEAESEEAEREEAESEEAAGEAAEGEGTADDEPDDE